jgi:hypothetical protein
VARIVGGTYSPPGTGAAGGGAATQMNLTATLHPEDRALLRAVADRPVSVKVGEREIARAAATGTRTNGRR